MRVNFKLLIVPAVMLSSLAAPARAEPLQAGTYHEAVRCAAIDTIMSAVMGMSDDEESQTAAKRLDAATTHWLAIADALKKGTREEMAADYTAEANAVTDVATNSAKGSDAEKAMGEDMSHCIAREQALFP